MKKVLGLPSIVLIALTVGGQAVAHPGGANVPSPDLPPIIPEGYLSPADVHARYSGPALEVVLSMVQHQPFASQPPFFGPEGERHHFESNLNAVVSVNGGPPMPISMSGPVDTVAFGKGLTDITGTFQVEMLQMQLTGGPIMIRESPTLQSLGQTTIIDIGGGMYHIDSFFDVFTELSVDGGATWLPSNVGRDGQSHPTRVYLGGIPEPASLALVMIGLFGACGFTRRR